MEKNLPAINRESRKDKLHAYTKHPAAAVWTLLVHGAAILTFVCLIFLIGYIVISGAPHLNKDLFALQYTSENGSLMPALWNTLIMTAVSLLIAVPLGVFAAVYLAEYARRGNRLVSLIRVTAETLSGIPSIVYGLFGMLFFVVALKMDYSLLAGSLTLTIMILPLIMRTTEEALLSVDNSYREGSFGLGAGKLRTVFCIVLPSAIPGILSGVILGIGRIVGETAALIYTAGTVARGPSGLNFLMKSGRTMAVHMYVLSGEGLHVDQAYGTALVLLVMVIGINLLSGWIAKKLVKGN